MDVDVSSDASAVRIRHLPAAVGLVFATVLVVSRLAQTWEIDGGRQPLWLSSGVAIGAALAVRRAWRAPIVAASLAALAIHSAVFVRDDAWGVFGDLTAATIEVVGGLLVFVWLFRDRRGFGRSGTTLAAFLLCFALPALGALASVAWFGPDDPLVFLWSRTLGNGLGMAAAGALFLLLRGPGNWLLGADPARNAISLGLGLIVTAALVVTSFATDGQVTYLVVAGLLWLSVRYGPRIGLPAALATVVYACVRTAHGAGPFGGETTEALLGLEAFNAALVLSTALVSRYSRGIDRERRRNHALLTALPDTITVHTDGSRVDVLSAEQATPNAADPIAAWIREDPPQPDFGVELTRQHQLDIDGETRCIESRSLRVDRHTVLSVSRDISELMQLLDDLNDARRHWRRLATTAYEGFLEVDVDNRIVFATPRLAEMMAAEIDDLVGVPFSELFEPDDFAKLAEHARAVRDGHSVLFETDFRRRNGERAWCIVSGRPLTDDDGTFTGAIMFAAETTELHEEAAGRAAAEVRLSSVEQLERQRIARHLHDGPLQSLVALSYQLHALTKGADSNPELAARLEQLAIDSVNRMRDALEDLVPPTLPEGELGPALRRVGSGFMGVDLPTIGVDVRTGTAIPETVAIGLYHIGREAIVNAILHAEASTITVTVDDHPDGFSVRVEDDGVGGVAEPRSPDGHLGLRAMNDRAAEVGGSCSVQPAAGGGTVVEAVLPRTRAEAVAP